MEPLSLTFSAESCYEAKQLSIGAAQCRKKHKTILALIKFLWNLIAPGEEFYYREINSTVIYLQQFYFLRRCHGIFHTLHQNKSTNLTSASNFSSVLNSESEIFARYSRDVITASRVVKLIADLKKETDESGERTLKYETLFYFLIFCLTFLCCFVAQTHLQSLC